jgi:phosphoglycolate phosphatase-like HAD superfamily hydrolase
MNLAAFAEKYGRTPEPAEICSFIECFASLLNDHHSMNAHLLRQVPGAAGLLVRLQQHPHWRPAIATGGWEWSARFKIAAAGINADGTSTAFGEDGPARHMIVKAVIARACATYGTASFEQTVTIGDAIWDVHTAQHLGLPFVGVGSGEEAAMLRNAGAITVIENFLDYGHCLESFESSDVPRLHSQQVSGQ